MAAQLLLLAILGASVVADLVVENTGTGAIAVLGHPITGDRDGLLLAMAAALGLVIGPLVVGSLSLRRTRQAASAAAPSCRFPPFTDDRAAAWPGVLMGLRFPDLLAAAQGGDEQVFAVLWRDLQLAMLRYFQVVAAQAAEDLAADIWMAVIGGPGRFWGEERAFRAWVFTVARHRAIDWRRQATRRPTDLVPAKRLGERPAPDDLVLQVLEGQSTRAALALVAELPADQAKVEAAGCCGV
jgi:DNA-directed RNA polymerase specialized sigma24 family protein